MAEPIGGIEETEQEQVVGDAVYSGAEAEKDFQAAMSDEEKTQEEPEPEPEPEPDKEKIEPAQAPEPIINPELAAAQARNAELEARNSAQEARLTALEEKTRVAEPEPEIPENIQALYTDYPEIKEAIILEARKIAGESGNTSEIVQQLTDKIATQENSARIASYVDRVTRGFSDDNGVWIEGVPDADFFTAQPEFQNYIVENEAKNPKFRETLQDPAVMIKTIKTLKSAGQKQKTKAEEYFSDGIPQGASRSDRGGDVLPLKKLFEKEMKAA